MDKFDESLEFNALYDSMWKCRRGKLKKASVARYVCHGIEETLKLEESLKDGTYKPRAPHKFRLTYPKERMCSSIHIRDRIVQRSVNDNYVYPEMTKSFIWDNFACQKGKGTTKAMDRINRFLRRYHINHGSNNGWVLQCDIHGYYRNMRHDLSMKCFERHLDKDHVKTLFRWLHRQYPYDVGFECGSQMVQILGISLLDPVDHFVKETLRQKYYMRYMDDFIIISDDKEELARCKSMIASKLEEYGMELHPKKSRIFPIQNGIKVLGFTFKLTKTGKVIRLINPENVKHERKKLFRMKQLAVKGVITTKKMQDCYTAWKAHAKKGNTYKLLRKMDAYFESLIKEVKENASTSPN